jgi:hypothetical protein
MNAIFLYAFEAVCFIKDARDTSGKGRFASYAVKVQYGAA